MGKMLGANKRDLTRFSKLKKAKKSVLPKSLQQECDRTNTFILAQ